MLLGFKNQFVEPILIGTKVHTIRKPRKVTPKIGETLHMYTALRTQHCKLISNKEKLISKQKITVLIRRIPNDHYFKICVDDRQLTISEVHKLAKFDGFKTLLEFLDYWLKDEKGKKINKVSATMDLYHWTDLKY